MATKSEQLIPTQVFRDEYWHLFRLQSLSPSQFVTAVDRILGREAVLVGPSRTTPQQQGQ